MGNTPSASNFSWRVTDEYGQQRAELTVDVDMTGRGDEPRLCKKFVVTEYLVPRVKAALEMTGATVTETDGGMWGEPGWKVALAGSTGTAASVRVAWGVADACAQLSVSLDARSLTREERRAALQPVLDALAAAAAQFVQAARKLDAADASSLNKGLAKGWYAEQETHSMVSYARNIFSTTRACDPSAARRLMKSVAAGLQEQFGAVRHGKRVAGQDVIYLELPNAGAVSVYAVQLDSGSSRCAVLYVELEAPALTPEQRRTALKPVLSEVGATCTTEETLAVLQQRQRLH